MTHAHSRRFGFTIIELTVVIVIIAILATLTTVAYLSTQRDAREKSLTSDLSNVESELARYATNNSGYYGSALDWDSSGGSNVNIDFTPTDGNVIVVTATSTGYCIKAYNPATSYDTLTNAQYVESEPGACGGSGSSNGGVVSTFVGSGTAGFNDATGTSAQFYYPGKTAFDSSGFMYVADASNHRIRKVSPAGVVTTFAGSGSPGSSDGIGTAASFSGPNGVAVDSADNVYVTDRGNQTLRKITPAQVVTTLAGSAGQQGHVNGTGAAARFDYPNSVAIGPADQIYVGDYSGTIRTVSAGGTVSDFVGTPYNNGYVNGTGAAARFDADMRMAIDSNGNIYVADYGNYRIRKVTPAGVVTTLAGSSTRGYADGQGATAQFYAPYDVAVDSAGNVYVIDPYNNFRVRKITPSGLVSTLAGSGENAYLDGVGTAAKFSYMYGIGVDDNDVLYVSEAARIRKIE